MWPPGPAEDEPTLMLIEPAWSWRLDPVETVTEEMSKEGFGMKNS